jgi:hypothetical protein
MSDIRVEMAADREARRKALLAAMSRETVPIPVSLFRDMHEALGWADTYVHGRLPDRNTMTVEEISQYRNNLFTVVTCAYEQADAMLRQVSGQSGDEASS